MSKGSETRNEPVIPYLFVVKGNGEPSLVFEATANTTQLAKAALDDFARKNNATFELLPKNSVSTRCNKVISTERDVHESQAVQIYYSAVGEYKVDYDNSFHLDRTIRLGDLRHLT